MMTPYLTRDLSCLPVDINSVSHIVNDDVCVLPLHTLTCLAASLGS